MNGQNRRAFFEDLRRAIDRTLALGIKNERPALPQAKSSGAHGGNEVRIRVDHDYALTVAGLARRNGTPTFVLNSAIGAHPSSRFFYNRVKGELERDLAKLDFESLTFVRPGLIGGRRDERRPAERIASIVLRILHPILPRRLRINPAERIAQALIDAAIAGTRSQELPLLGCAVSRALQRMLDPLALKY